MGRKKGCSDENEENIDAKTSGSYEKVEVTTKKLKKKKKKVKKRPKKIKEVTDPMVLFEGWVEKKSDELKKNYTEPMSADPEKGIALLTEAGNEGIVEAQLKVYHFFALIDSLLLIIYPMISMKMLVSGM